MDGDRRNDLVTSGPRGLVVSIAGEDGTYTPVPVRGEPTGPFAAIDLNRDDDWDLIWAAGDAVGLVEFDEGVWNARHGVTFPDAPGEVTEDLAAIRGAFTEMAQLRPEFTYAGHEVVVCGDLAVHLAPWTMTATGPDGTPIADRGLSVAVLRRQQDGAWRLVIDNPHGDRLLK